MGAAVATMSASINSDLATSESSSCTVESICQNASVGSFDILGTMDCTGDITLAGNYNTSSFTCSVNQAATSVANLSSKFSNSATAMWGDISDASTNINISSTISQTLSSGCGGSSASRDPDAKGQPAASAGACRTGIIQNADVKNIQVGGAGHLSCKDFSAGVNHNNSHVTCTMSQVAKADQAITTSATNVAKGANIFFMVLMILIVCVFVVMMLPFLPYIGSRLSGLIGNTLDVVGEKFRGTKLQRRLAAMKRRRSIQKEELELVDLTARRKEAEKRTGVTLDDIMGDDDPDTT